VFLGTLQPYLRNSSYVSLPAVPRLFDAVQLLGNSCHFFQEKRHKKNQHAEAGNVGSESPAANCRRCIMEGDYSFDSVVCRRFQSVVSGRFHRIVIWGCSRWPGWQRRRRRLLDGSGDVRLLLVCFHRRRGGNRRRFCCCRRLRTSSCVSGLYVGRFSVFFHQWFGNR